MKSFDQLREQYSKRVEEALTLRMPVAEGSCKRLNAALAYSCLGGGKRLRAMLVYGSGQLFGINQDILDVPACSVELIHAYSLAHDDLPCMDDDDLRRGRPTCHRAFDEATALLAGDAAQSLAFELLATDPALAVSDAQRLGMVCVLSVAAGVNGMAGGQSIDMEATGETLSLEQLKQMHSLKTGALITASCVLGGMAFAGISDRQLDILTDYGRTLGLAFQVMDDVLDVTANTETLGKVAGADEKMQKSTYVSILGIDEAVRIRNELCASAVESAHLLGDNGGMLENLAHFVGNRSY